MLQNVHSQAKLTMNRLRKERIVKEEGPCKKYNIENYLNNSKELHKP